MGIEVIVKASSKQDESDAIAVGSLTNVISNKDRNAFKLSNYNLIKATGLCMGRKPTQAYVKSPTPWGDLYKTYKWQQVQKTLQPTSAVVLGINTRPVIVVTQDFKNKSSVDVKYHASIHHQVTNTVSSSWSVHNEISVDQKISYKVNFLIGGTEGETSLSYKHSWGEEHSESKGITLGAESGVEITLKPGKAVTAVLSATQGTMDVEVQYNSSLDGQVAINYPDRYEGHHFYGPYIDEVMAVGDLENTLNAKEVLKIGFYSEGKITVYDKDSSKQLLVVPATFKTTTSKCCFL